MIVLWLVLGAVLMAIVLTLLVFFLGFRLGGSSRDNELLKVRLDAAEAERQLQTVKAVLETSIAVREVSETFVPRRWPGMASRSPQRRCCSL